MAWTERFTPYGRWDHFTFFDSGRDGAALGIDLDLTFDRLFVVDEVRLHLSVVHASIEDFKIKLSSILNSGLDEHNVTFVSQAMVGIQDVIWRAGSTVFQSGDRVKFSMHLSNANYWGLTVTGWAVQTA